MSAHRSAALAAKGPALSVTSPTVELAPPAVRRTATGLGLRLPLGREHCIRAQQHQADTRTLGCLNDSEGEACPPEPLRDRSRTWQIARCCDNLVVLVRCPT